MKIVPAIIPRSFEDLRDRISEVKNFTDEVHIDLMNGSYVPYLTWPYHDKDQRSINIILNEEDGMPFWQEVRFEFDLMISEAHKDLDFFIRLGTSRLVFHPDAEGSLDSFKEFLEGIDLYTRDYVKIGIAIEINSDIEKLESLFPFIDFVQCMGIEHVGRQGEEFDERVFDNIKNIKEKFPEIEISVDGSVNKGTIEMLKDAGATRFVIGSAIFNTPHAGSAVEEFASMIE